MGKRARHWPISSPKVAGAFQSFARTSESAAGGESGELRVVASANRSRQDSDVCLSVSSRASRRSSWARRARSIRLALTDSVTLKRPSTTKTRRGRIRLAVIIFAVSDSA